MIKFLKKILGYCPTCRKLFKYPKRRRMNTQFVVEERNYCYECKECFYETQEHWAEMWNDYYSGVL